MVGVTTKILSGDFPVAGYLPFMHTAKDFYPAFSPVKEHVQVPFGFTEVFVQGRGVRIKGSENKSLVAIDLCYRNQAPLATVKFAVVGVFEIRD